MSTDFGELSDLIGEEISAVCFVRDYVEFHFDGPVLRSISNPSATIDGTIFHYPDPGSRDALCRVIGSTVRSVILEEQQAFVLTTIDNCQIEIPLDDKRLQGPEAMHFIHKKSGPIQVW